MKLKIEMKVAIMQPYFLPYIGYFNLISSVDIFVIYDEIKYTKRGWINRNRMMNKGKEKIFSLPLRKDSNSLDICSRELAHSFNKKKLLNQFKSSYEKAQYFNETYNLLENIIFFDDKNLFNYIYNSIKLLCRYLDINTNLVVSSEINCNKLLNGQDRVLDICSMLEAKIYINSIGGKDLYCSNDFMNRDINLFFLKSKLVKYRQMNSEFIPWLSIIDLLMFNSKEKTKTIVSEQFDLLK